MDYFRIKTKNNLVWSVRHKNKSIYQFILDLEREKNRERTLKENARKQKLLGQSEQSVTFQQDSGIIEKPLAHEIFKSDGKDRRLMIELAVSAVMAGFSLLSILVLFKVDALIHQSLYSHGFSLFLAELTPYWIIINSALGIFWLAATAAIVFKIYVSKQNGKLKA